jgi:hypothetical protein
MLLYKAVQVTGVTVQSCIGDWCYCTKLYRRLVLLYKAVQAIGFTVQSCLGYGVNTVVTFRVKI